MFKILIQTEEEIPASGGSGREYPATLTFSGPRQYRKIETSLWVNYRTTHSILGASYLLNPTDDSEIRLSPARHGAQASLVGYYSVRNRSQALSCRQSD